MGGVSADRPSILAECLGDLPKVFALPSRRVTRLACTYEWPVPELVEVALVPTISVVDFSCFLYDLKFLAPLTQWLNAQLIFTDASPSGRAIQFAISLGLITAVVSQDASLSGKLM